MNNNIISQFSLYITKSSISDGIMRWSAINSDTESDLYGEKMTLELYKKMLGYIKNSIPPPKEFQKFVCSEYWCGGMPYVSLAHYPDLNGKAVLGQPTELFIDGKQLKAKGVLFDNPLGRATWKSLKEDENIPIDEERIRISIAFLDLAHKHGQDGNIFKRESLNSDCPECDHIVNGKVIRGTGNKIYLDGYLVHLATTRKPVNTRTIMLTEDAIMTKKSEIKTRKDDALSIVKDEALVDAIDQEAMSVKSDVLIEMSEAVEEVETPVVEESSHKKDMPMDEEEMDTSDDEGTENPDGTKKKKVAKKSLTLEDVQVLIKDSLEEFAKHVNKPMADDPELVAERVELQKGTDDLEATDISKASKKKIIKSTLDVAVDSLYNQINEALQLESTVEEKLNSINPALQEIGTAITTLVRESVGEKPIVPVSADQSLVLEAVSSLKDVVQNLATEVATLKAQTQVPANLNRIPVPRSVPTQAAPSTAGKAVNPLSVENIVRRSVSVGQVVPLPLVDR